MSRGLIAIIFLASLACAADLPRKAQLGVTFAVSDGKLAIVRVSGNAEKAGLKSGDIIVSANKEPARPESVFVRPLARRIAGDRVDFQIQRDNHEQHITVDYQPPPKERDVKYDSVETDGHLRRTLITVPAQPGRHPAILWIAGSGCGSQESPDGSAPEVQLLYELTKRGYVTMRVEKTAMGDSDGPPCYSEAGGMTQEVHGYVAGINALRNSDFVDPQRIYLFGHSAGSTLAPLVAKKQPIRGMVLAGVMGTNFLDYVLAMRRRELAADGKKAPEISAEMEKNERCIGRLVRDRETPDAIEQAMPDCQHRVRFDSPPPYMREWADMDLNKTWAAAPNVPVLILLGEADIVSSKVESQALVNVINKAHPKRANLKVLEMDHGFVKDGKLNSDVAEQTDHFLRSN